MTIDGLVIEQLAKWFIESIGKYSYNNNIPGHVQPEKGLLKYLSHTLSIQFTRTILGATDLNLKHEASFRYVLDVSETDPEAMPAKVGRRDPRLPQLPDPELPLRREQTRSFVDARLLSTLEEENLVICHQ